MKIENRRAEGSTNRWIEREREREIERERVPCEELVGRKFEEGKEGVKDPVGEPLLVVNGAGSLDRPYRRVPSITPRNSVNQRDPPGF